MLKARIIPCLDVHEGRVVKGVNFLNLKDAGDPVKIARRYEEQGADELIFLDISASQQGRAIMIEIVSKVSEQIFMPFTVGGGISSLEDATRLIQAGAEKVSINSSAVKNPDLVNQISERFGKCATVVNIDPKRVKNRHGVVWEVHINGGRVPTGKEAVAWACEVESRGAGEIVLTSMDADGTKNGYDVEMTRAVAERVGVPVVASGGAGCPEHLYEILTVGKASAALAASIFHYDEFGIQTTKKYLAAKGVPIRL
ncbi:MAG: imidazole glycerol phosphate synthase subunit HisF [Gemmataceae bacterium]|nr:imidazole glycerol phosphate synthase subunit HisF [Gemmataceae bacterium]